MSEPGREAPSGSATSAPRRGSKEVNQFLFLPLGGVGGCVAKTATSPLERIRVLAQTGAVEKGILHSAREIFEAEGLRGYWRGNFTNCLRVFPAKGVLFATNDIYRGWLRSLLGITGSNPTSLGFMSGSLAGITACVATYPLDFARTRLAGVTGRDIGLMGILKEAVHEGGYRALFRGCLPTVIGAIPYEGMKFGLYAMLTADTGEPKGEVPVEQKMAYGAFSGMTAAAFIYPNDTVRKLMQISGNPNTVGEHHGEELYKNFWDCYKTTYRKGGISRFYRGIFPYMLRSMPNAAIQFSVYESLKSFVKEKHS
jgi:solute carrier family 25 phosphate transporter 23/24/25/41